VESTLVGLIAELPEGVVVTDPDILESYRQDRAADPGAGTPLAVVRPRRTEEVQTVMRWATANKIAPSCPAAWAPGCRAGRPP
jgi:FAD/FMN-containing dehydrogenase